MSRPIIALDARLVGTSATGDATYWRGLIEGLARLDLDATFLLCSNEPKPSIVPNHRSLVWKQVPSIHSRLWSLVSFPMAARKAGTSVIHTQYNLSPLAARFGVTTVHDVSFRIEPSWFQPKDRLLLGKFVGSSMRRAKRVITVSETSKQDIARFYPSAAEKCRVTPLAAGLGVNPIPTEEAQRIVREKLSLDSPYLLTVGTRWPRKNMNLALDAAALLPDSLPHRMVVTGKPGWGEERANKRVLATGYVDDQTLSALYQCADLYLAPSRYEGFGLTLLEAFTLGCPVLCSSGGAQPEVAGDAALIMNQWDPPSWAEAIQNLLNDSSKLAQMKQRGVQRAAQFDWKTTASLTWDVYREVIG